jgi:hypothetical protein
VERFERHGQERNLEKDKRSFEEAVAGVAVKEIQTDFDKEATEKLAKSVASTKLFMLGEMHGVEENADVIYTLFKKFGFRQLALEWDPALKSVVERFAGSGTLDFDAIQDSPDGRITAGHFGLIKKLKSEGLLEALICFDGNSNAQGWNARDAAMARNILANLSDRSTLVVAGNLHTKTEPIMFDDELGEQHPMGENVKKEIPEVASGRIEYAKGHFYNYGVKDFAEIAKHEPRSTARFHLSDDGLFLFELPEAHAAIVPNPHERI